MERGCWVVEMDGWVGKAKVDFWKLLKSNVEQGRCGAVGVFLGEEDYDTASGGVESGKAGGPGVTLGWKRRGKQPKNRWGDRVKIYCWGKAVELMWAFLFVISNRKTKCGAVWVDAGGEAVIRC